MKTLIFALVIFSSVSAFAGVSHIRCQLEGRASLNGKEVKFADASILGKIQGEDVIFNEFDPNYQHVKTVRSQGQKTFTYAIEGVDFRNNSITVIIYTKRNTASAIETTSIFKVPLIQKRFVVNSGAYTDGSKETHQLKLACEIK